MHVWLGSVVGWVAHMEPSGAAGWQQILCWSETTSFRAQCRLDEQGKMGTEVSPLPILWVPGLALLHPHSLCLLFIFPPA